MRIVQRHELDVVRWDKLVADSNCAIFSYSFYLDAVAENWCVLVDDAYSRGIALPYVVKLGQKTLYTPFFVRYIEWLGPEDQGACGMIKELFKRADVNVRSNLLGAGEQLVFQEVLPKADWKLNEQSKRMLKKFGQSGIFCQNTDQINDILKVIKDELPEKVDSLNSDSIGLLERLLTNLKKAEVLRIVKAVDGDEIVGGAFFIEYGDRVTYLKSAFREKGKKDGAMYAIMNEQIRSSRSKNQLFDFGGSRVESVRRFNLNLGGTDTYYFRYTWDASPFWFRLILWMRRLLRSGRSFRVKM